MARQRVTRQYRRDLRKANRQLAYQTGITNKTRARRDRELAELRDLNAQNKELETVLRDKYGHTAPVIVHYQTDKTAKTKVEPITKIDLSMSTEDKRYAASGLASLVISLISIYMLSHDVFKAGDAGADLFFVLCILVAGASLVWTVLVFVAFLIIILFGIIPDAVHNLRLKKEGDAGAPTLTEAETRMKQACAEEDNLLEQINVIRTRKTRAEALATKLGYLKSDYEAEEARQAKQIEKEKQTRLRQTAEETVDAMLDATSPSRSRTDLERFDKEMRAITETSKKER